MIDQKARKAEVEKLRGSEVEFYPYVPIERKENSFTFSPSKLLSFSVSG
jgi:hypothetical protein